MSLGIMNYTLLPLLVIFDLDDTLLKFRGSNVVYPCLEKNGKIFDAFGDVLEYFPQGSAVFEKLQNSGIKIAIYEQCKDVNGTIQLLNMLGWNKYISYMELESDESDTAIDIGIKRIHQKSNIPFSKMIYVNNKDITRRKCYEDLGVFNVYVDLDFRSMTAGLLDQGLQEYISKQQGENKFE